MNPFIAFCVYVAARVFVQYLKVHNDDAAVISSLQFLLAAMQALKAKNPLTESFLVQLDVDLEGSGLRIPVDGTGQASVPLRASTDKSVYIPNHSADQHDCVSLFDIRVAQEPNFEAANVHSKEPAVSKGPTGNPRDFSRMSPQQLQQPRGGFPDRSKGSPLPPAPDALIGGAASMYAENSGVMDMDLSFENVRGQRYNSLSTSEHPTPSTSSNNASSQTSFSPPHIEEHANLKSTSTLANVSPNTATSFSNNQNYPPFTPDLPHSAKLSSPEGASNPFAMHGAWNHADGGQVLGNSAGQYGVGGMTPDEIQSWQPMTMNDGNEWAFANWNGADTST
jgi:hypothetical protein